MAWTQSLLILKDGGRICADSLRSRPCVSYWWRCEAWCLLIGGDAVAGWVFYVDSLLSGLLQSLKMLKKNFATEICVYVCGLHIEWEGISCVFLEST